jgi:hypothetical protein
VTALPEPFVIRAVGVGSILLGTGSKSWRREGEGVVTGQKETAVQNVVTSHDIQLFSTSVSAAFPKIHVSKFVSRSVVDNAELESGCKKKGKKKIFLTGL